MGKSSDIQFEIVQLDVIGTFLIKGVFYLLLEIIQCNEQQGAERRERVDGPLRQLLVYLVHQDRGMKDVKRRIKKME